MKRIMCDCCDKVDYGNITVRGEIVVEEFISFGFFNLEHLCNTCFQKIRKEADKIKENGRKR